MKLNGASYHVKMKEKRMECECKNLSTIKNSKDCKCNACGKIWIRKDGEWCINPKLNEVEVKE